MIALRAHGSRNNRGMCLGLRASDVAKELDVEAMAVAPATGFAGFDDPIGTLARGRYDAFGHEKDLLGKQALELGEKLLDLDELRGFAHNELELARWIEIDKLLEHAHVEAAFFVASAPDARWVARVADYWSAVGELGADGHQVAVEIAKDSPCGFDGYVDTFASPAVAQAFDRGKEHGLATGQYDMADCWSGALCASYRAAFFKDGVERANGAAWGP